MNDDRVSWHLWNWSGWMRAGKTDHLKHRKAASSGIGKSNSSTFDDMLASLDARCAHATDAAIDDLPRWDKCAVYEIHLEQKCDLPKEAVRLYYRAACIEIGRKLDRAGIA